ncbi:MAG TPA: MMPL family transporter [Solirubrobacteraceae bacterium]|nr:MMPL family transporter [Solirubrobacteraceae bacterium]
MVIVGWVVIAILTSVIAQAVGRNYASDFTLPGTESQRASDLLTKQFPVQSGDTDTIVFHYSKGTIDSSQVSGPIDQLLAKVAKMPHVVAVISPYSSAGAVQVSHDRTTGFATVNFSKRANLLPSNTGVPVLNAVNGVHVPGLQLAAGGQVIEQAEGFSVGPATEVGVIAALIILLITFGSLTAAGMPLITAGLGLITGVAVIGLATRVISMSNVGPQLALMIGLGVGIDYALFIVTRFKENYSKFHDIDRSIIESMDTSGRAVLLAGTTVVIALLGMFATGVSFLYGLAIAAVIAVVLVLAASLTVLPAILSSKWGERIVRPRGKRRGLLRRREPVSVAPAGNGAGAVAVAAPQRRLSWRRWSMMVQSHPWPLAILSTAVMIAVLLPVFAIRLENSDAGNDPSGTSTRQAFDLLAKGFGPGFNGPLLLVAQLPAGNQSSALSQLQKTVSGTKGVVAVTQPKISPSGSVAVMQAFPGSAPQATATTDLVNRLRHSVLPNYKQQTKVAVLVGGFTAGSIDFSHVLATKLPLFIGLVVVLSALLLMVMFRSLVIPVQAAIMNLLSIGGALGLTTLVFQDGYAASVFGVEKAPIEPWVPVIMFAVVFGLSMDYEVFLISRIREEWMRRRNARVAVVEGIAFTGRVITAAAAIMICVFLSFALGNERSLKEFGFGLAVAVFLDAVIVRCVMLPAVLELLGPITWRLPRWVDARLPHINIEGSAARALPEVSAGEAEERETEPTTV